MTKGKEGKSLVTQIQYLVKGCVARGKGESVGAKEFLHLLV